MAETSSSAHSSRPGPARNPRAYRAADGTAWRVYEYAAPDDGVSLMFESRDAFRRVWRYPAHWRELRDAELEALSWGR
ncbi:MAG TPA: hypothetical protein VNA89_11080 [Gemmatimonadaceae bacterium]|nr:hypothetical protein [Gemmatimonadaceae bacterium]